MDEKLLERLPRFSWTEVKKHIAAKKPFEAISPMGTALIRIRDYQPLLGLAVHAGHQVREELQMKMAIEDTERKMEEGPCTDDFVAGYPMQMIALDSRYEFDIDRSREEAVYLKPFQSWGKKVWRTPPTKEELQISFQKYDEFHELLDYMVGEFCTMFGKLLCLDLHTFNPKRPSFIGKTTPLPMFSVSTLETDRKQHAPTLDTVMSMLAKAPLTGSSVKENEPFKKDGALTLELSKNYPTSLFLPIEVKNTFLNEESGDIDENIAAPLRQLFRAVGQAAYDRFTSSGK